MAKVVCKAACTLFLPPPLRLARILWHMVPFVRRGMGCLLRRRVKVELLDALSISISAFRGDFDTAGTGHVPAGGGRAAGGVDKEEICGGSGPVHVAECGPGLAAHSPGRSAGSCVPDPAGGLR